MTLSSLCSKNDNVSTNDVYWNVDRGHVASEMPALISSIKIWLVLMDMHLLLEKYPECVMGPKSVCLLEESVSKSNEVLKSLNLFVHRILGTPNFSLWYVVCGISKINKPNCFRSESYYY